MENEDDLLAIWQEQTNNRSNTFRLRFCDSEGYWVVGFVPFSFWHGGQSKEGNLNLSHDLDAPMLTV